MASDRWLIVGLGNPGSDYAHNRHNVGYWCVNHLSRVHGINLKARTLAATGEGQIAGHPVTLLKPRTYVNRSGHAVAPALRHSSIAIERLIVVYDELDLPSGRMRIKPKGGHGGHNGIRSIAAAVASTDFIRIRVGIGRPHVGGEPTWDPEVVADYVLGDPAASEIETLRTAVTNASNAVEMIVTEGVEAAMNRYNK
ncbi:MAG TPA: aminoacyl-tRNA hydrolase [Dehalococcoidia bacterium]|nr:aminoacyl-tRNA hydrolase [Dehalococcoidia bacterium]